MMEPGMMGGGGMMMAMMIVISSLFVGLIVGGVWLIGRAIANGGSSGGASGSASGSDSALQIFEERYARGEISRQEFTEGREALRR